MNNETPKKAARRLAAKHINKGFKPIALHVYCDSAGKELYWRIRLKNPSTGEKYIRPMYRDDQGTLVLGEPKFDNHKPLYRLFDLIQHPEEIVWITEGELCADHLCKLGLVATTSGGAESAASADWSPLAKRKIIIWPDNDEAGLRYANEVTKLLQSLELYESEFPNDYENYYSVIYNETLINNPGYDGKIFDGIIPHEHFLSLTYSDDICEEIR